MRIGVIGTGNIGGMLAKAFAECPDTEVYVYNRTIGKAHALADAWQRIYVLPNEAAVADAVDVVFLCTKSGEGISILEDIGPRLSCRQYLVPTISTLPCSQLESCTDAGVAKVIPSIVQSVRSGILLVSHGPSLTPDQQVFLDHVFRRIATPFVVAEDQLRVASDLTSCGPAFIAYLLQLWAEAAERTGRLTRVQAEHLLTSTVVGLAQLLQSGVTIQDIITKVCVPGGVTECGMTPLREAGPALFDTLHEATSHHAQRPPMAPMLRE
ncbi:pyrroline-5-carboxylate reductase [Alicyclobacillus contaminans]|uniref:pyrroline-5-carboxylate reductase dimerization domain-containing protein n=1 Tax=Alicyclobacillus contaminans TaxID=392016 RepID=UPI00047A6C1C|nr:pyrroline-5-carboxylate reductase dimerization domain-containing protein [Alicyclobacillus contaminans]GMA49976.1 pyrroline-5-carboxylate reductase [Alicyclobacillus contaminans]